MSFAPWPPYLSSTLREPSLTDFIDRNFNEPAQPTTITDLVQKSLREIPQASSLDPDLATVQVLPPPHPTYTFPASSSSTASSLHQLPPAIPTEYYVPLLSPPPGPAEPESKRMEYYVTPITKCKNKDGEWSEKQRTIAMMAGLTMEQKVFYIGKSRFAITEFLRRRKKGQEYRSKRRDWSNEEKKIATNNKFSMDKKMQLLPGRNQHAIEIAALRFGNHKPSKKPSKKLDD